MLSARAGWRRRRTLSLGLGLTLLLGSWPAEAAGAGSLVPGGLTTWIGLLATVWAVLASAPSSEAMGTGVFAVVAIAAMARLGWGWHGHHRRVGAPASRGPSGAFAAPLRAPASLLSAKPIAPSPADWPAALDGEQVLDAARSRFFRLQAAWDAGDVAALGHLTTPDMLEQLLSVLTARGAGPNRTDIISLHAELLAVEEVNAAYLASVEFSGLIRESAEQGAVPFRELWMLASVKDGAPSWRLARQQALF